MKKHTTILALMAFGLATATAGVAPAPSGKGAAMPPPADPCAGPISYNNVELIYATTDSDLGNSEDGLSVRLEYSPMANLYFTGAISYSDTDFGNSFSLSAGIGGFVPLTENIHLAGDIGLLYADFDTCRLIQRDTKGNNFICIKDSESDTGWYVRPHVRAKMGCLEAHAGFEYLDINGEDDWSWYLQLYYQVAPGWDITAGYSQWDQSNQDTFTAGVRYKF